MKPSTRRLNAAAHLLRQVFRVLRPVLSLSLQLYAGIAAAIAVLWIGYNLAPCLGGFAVLTLVLVTIYIAWTVAEGRGWRPPGGRP